MSNSRAEGACWPSALDRVVAETAAGRLLPGVHRCLLRVETPRRPEGWTGAASTHRDDHGALDSEVAFRIASVTKLMTATALLSLSRQFVANTRWWPPFCLVIDWVAAAVLVVLLAVGVDFHN